MIFYRMLECDIVFLNWVHFCQLYPHCWKIYDLNNTNRYTESRLVSDILLVFNLWISGPLVLIFSVTNTDKSYLLYILFTVGNLLQASQSINLSNSEREINPLKQTRYPLGLMIQVIHSVLSFSIELI